MVKIRFWGLEDEVDEAMNFFNNVSSKDYTILSISDKSYKNRGSSKEVRKYMEVRKKGDYCFKYSDRIVDFKEKDFFEKLRSNDTIKSAMNEDREIFDFFKSYINAKGTFGIEMPLYFEDLLTTDRVRLLKLPIERIKNYRKTISHYQFAIIMIFWNQEVPLNEIEETALDEFSEKCWDYLVIQTDGESHIKCLLYN